MSILNHDPDIDVNELVSGEAILHHVCRHSHSELIDVLVSRPDIDVNLKNHDGLAGLHIACQSDNVAIVGSLLQSPHTNVNIRSSSDSSTPLHIAAMQGNASPIKSLLEMAEIDVQAEDAHGYLPLHYAAEHLIATVDSIWASKSDQDCRDVLLRLCGNGAVNTMTPHKRGPIYLAAKAGNILALEVFLTQSDLDINMRDAQGETALHLAEHIDTVGILCEKGLNANIQNVDGNTALHIALEWKLTVLVHSLLRNTKLDADMPNKKGQQFMHIAAAQWDVEVFKEVVATPPSGNINIRDGLGETALHISARADNIDIVKHLLSIPSVHVNAQNDEGQTPLHLACERGHIDVVRLLLANAYIDGDVGDVDGYTSLHLASRSALCEPIVCDLLRVISDIDRRVPASGATALHFAAFEGNVETVMNLLERGADPQLTCRGLDGANSDVDLDAGGLAKKIEVIDLIRHYRRREISLEPSTLSASQVDLLKRHANGAYVVWNWPRAEKLDEHSKSPWRKRQRTSLAISSVSNIYERLAAGFRKGLEPCEEEQWQLRHEDRHYTRKGRRLERERRTRWVHFSAQNRRWVEEFCKLLYSHESLHTEGTDVLTFLDDTFNKRSVASGHNEDLDREHCVEVSSLPEVTDRETNEDITTESIYDGRGPPHYSVAAIVIPLIDIDMMMPGFVKNSASHIQVNDNQFASMIANFCGSPELNTKEQAHIEMIQSFHSTFRSQKSRSLDQYFHHDLTDHDLQIVNAEQVLSRFIYHHQVQRGLHPRHDDTSTYRETTRPRRLSPVLIKVLNAVFGATSTDVREDRIEHGRDESNTNFGLARQHVLVVPQLWLWKIDMITSLPPRWDSSNLHSASEYIRSRVEFQDAEARPLDVLHRIMEACLEYQPTFSLFRRQLTYQDAFSGEISRISRDINQCYKGFRNDLGKSDDRFLDSFKTATTSLLDIDDVLNELKMIKRVYQNQAQVVTLLQLTQGSASTENALKASEQSKILAIFTVVTTPLSWVAALFALKIESFHAGETWTSGQVASGSGEFSRIMESSS
ncbi:hypothetical protein Daus18300_012777 [Diaporthe australafricana]|uniref:Ankyrin repeat protein n=1 Tax=Diaporthe australafricana TaxID=127596 RepID=A0ABR3W1K5_9PEZI